eukprot:1836438-Rhodomonas_salina.3
MCIRDSPQAAGAEAESGSHPLKDCLLYGSTLPEVQPLALGSLASTSQDQPPQTTSPTMDKMLPRSS